MPSTALPVPFRGRVGAAKGQGAQGKKPNCAPAAPATPLTDDEGNETGTEHPALLDPALMKSHEWGLYFLCSAPSLQSPAAAAHLHCSRCPPQPPALLRLVRLRGAGEFLDRLERAMERVR